MQCRGLMCFCVDTGTGTPIPGTEVSVVLGEPRCTPAGMSALFYLGCIPFDQSKSGFFDRKLDFFIPFHRNTISDCNLNDPPAQADWSYWYLKMVLDCSLHLINRFIDRILDCLIT